MSLTESLAAVTRIPGVRGALIVSPQDGLVVAEALMEGLDGGAVAALVGRVAERLRGLAAQFGHPTPTGFSLEAAEGALLAAWAASGLLVVAVTAPDVNGGHVRLELLDAAERAA